MSSREFTQDYWLSNVNYDNFLDVYLDLLKKFLNMDLLLV